MRSLFTPAINQPLNTLIDSATITLSGIGTGVPFTLVSGVGTSAYKNGASITSTTVSDGDRVRIRVRTSTAYATPLFGVIKIGNEESIFAASTIVDPTPVPTTAMDGILPIDLIQHSDGREYIPSHAENAVSVYDAGVLTKTVPLIAPSGNNGKTTDAVAIANYHSGEVFLLNNQLVVIARMLPEGANSKPYGITVSQTSLFDDDTLTWVTLSALNKVVVYNKNLNIVASYNTGSRPLGIASSPDRRHIYVANHNSNTVTHFAYSNQVWTPTTVNVGSKPFEIVVDAANNAWVTHTGANVVSKITSANVVSNYTLGVEGLRGIVLDAEGLVWVAASKSNSIVRLSSSGVVVATIPTSSYPYALSLASDGAIDVACFVLSKIESYSITGTKVRDYTTGKYPYGVSSFGTSTLVANLYSNTPDYATIKDQLATAFALADPARSPKNSVVTSTSFTVSGLGTGVAVPVGVPGDLYLSKIVKNSSVLGPSTTVVNGDVLALQFTTPNVYDTLVEIPMFVGNVYENYTSKTEIEDVTPDVISFADVINANLEEVYTSNVETISGLSNLTSVPFTIDEGTIVLNGVEVGLVASVKNGDTVALRLTTLNQEKRSISITAFYGKIITRSDGSTTVQHKEIWTVTTKQVINELWIKPEFKKLPEYAGAFVPRATTVDGRYITRISYGEQVSSLHITDTNVAHVPGNLLIPSYHDGVIYQFNGTSAFNPIAAADPVGYRPVGIANNRYIVYTGSANVLFDIQLGTSLNLAAIPRRVAYDTDADAVYVSLSNGTVIRAVAGAITNTYNIGGHPYALAVDVDGGLWVSDIQNDVVKYIVNGVVAKTIGTGKGVWDMAVSSTHLWTANSYDNTVSKIDVDTNAVTTIKVSWVPSQIEIDINNAVWVGHYASKRIWKLDYMSNEKTYDLELQYSSPTYMTKHEGHIYVTELNPLLVTMQDKVSVLTPLSIVFQDAFDELPSTRVKSNVVTVKDLMRPTAVHIEADNDYDLYVNDVKIANGVDAIIDNGDKVYIDALTASGFYVQRDLSLSDFQSSVFFRVRTETNVKPELVAFADIYNAIVRQTYESNAVTITGMTEGHTTTLSSDRTGWGVSVNGGPFTFAGQVKNGDLVELVGPARGPYGTSSPYKLLAGKHGYVLGTLVIYMKVLDGPSLYMLHQKHFATTAWELSTYRNATWVTTDAEMMFERSLSASNFHETDVMEFDVRPAKGFSVYSSEEMQFITTERGAALLSEAIKFETLQRYAHPTAAITEYTTGISIAGHENDLPGFIVNTQAVHDVDADIFQPQPSMHNGWVGNRHEIEFPQAITQSSSNQKLAPEPLYQKNTQSDRMTVERVYTVRTAKEYPSVNMQYVKNVTAGFREVATQFERNAVRLTNTFDAEAVLIRSRSSFLFSPPSQYQKVEHRRFRDMEPTTYIKLVGAQRTVQRNPFILAPQRKMLAWDSVGEVNTRNALTFEGSLSKFDKLESSFNIVEAMGPMLVARNVIAPELPSFIREQAQFIIGDRDYSRNTYVVHNYTFEETAEEQGAYSSAEAAIAAGVLAGYATAYSVQLSPNVFIWAAPIGTGNFCGIPGSGGGTNPDGPSPGGFALPVKWYTNGG